MYIYMLTYTCMCTYTCTCILHIFIHTHIHLYIHIYEHTHIRIYCVSSDFSNQLTHQTRTNSRYQGQALQSRGYIQGQSRKARCCKVSLCRYWYLHLQEIWVYLSCVRPARWAYRRPSGVPGTFGGFFFPCYSSLSWLWCQLAKPIVDRQPLSGTFFDGIFLYVFFICLDLHVDIFSPFIGVFM